MPFYRLPAFEGMVTALQPHHLKPSQATVLQNARVDTGSIVSTKAAVTSTSTTPQEITLNPDGNHSIAKYDARYYFVDNVLGTQGSSDGFLGVTPPLELVKTAPRGAGRFEGEFRYAITFETEDNVESAPIDINQQEFSALVVGSLQISDSTKLLQNAELWSIGGDYVAGTIVKHEDLFYRALTSHDNNDITSGALIQFRLTTYSHGGRGSHSQDVGPEIFTSYDPDPSRPGPSLQNTYFNGTDFNGIARSNFQYNYKEGLYRDASIGKLSQPGSGIQHTEYWQEIADETVTETDFKGCAEFLLSGIPLSSQADVVRRNIYRTVSFGNTFYLVRQLEDNVTTSYVDNLTDEDAQFRITLNTINAHPPLQVFDQATSLFSTQAGKYLTERNGVFFLAINNRLHFSNQGNPHAWNPLDWIKMDDEITAIAKTTDGILTFTKNRTYHILGDTADTVLKREILLSQGCQDFRTVSYVGNFPIWVSNDGICVWDGEAIRIINDSVYKLDFTPTYGEVSNDNYFLFGSDKSLFVDFRHNRQFQERNSFSDVKVAYYDVNADKFFVKDGKAILEDESGADETFVYQSPEIDVDQLAQVKHFRKVYVVANSALEIDVIFNGDTVQTITSAGTGRRSHYLKSGLTGNLIQFKVTGTGKFKELTVEYTPLKMS